ncbi:four-carbon acid sugar kinase family protein [Devosia lucknowensis]|nr:four-carbon acid sugar kinase family protein [Devosia lucknowensis]
MAELAIIADDLTGALDAAAPFAARGIATAVALGNGSLPEAIASGARIVGVSTDSREIAPEAAAAAVRRTLRSLSDGTRIFKKVDSRLKGNIAAELDVLPHGRSLVVPAIPDFGRVTRAGHIEGFGVGTPIDIASRLGNHALRADIPDAMTPADIERALEHQYDLVIGARGLAEAMAQMMAPDAGARPTPLPGGRAFCVIGSTDPITMTQLADLRASAGEMADLVAPNGVAPTSAGDLRLTLIQAAQGADELDGKAVAAALAASLRRFSPGKGDLLVLSGGATAQVILEAIGIDMLILLGEVQPGLPIAQAGGLTVVTKSGGFGAPDCLSRLLAPYASARSPVQSHVG